MSAITRRQLITGAAASQLALAQGRSRSGSQSKAQANIIFLMADDLGYADLSCYGRRDYTTPHLDALAAGGTRLLQAYANSPVCSSTRTALITGRYQYRLRVGLEEPIAALGANVGLPAEHPTLPSLLRKAGYKTALIGKWHLGRLPEYSPLQSGYDHFWGFRNGYVDYFTHKGSTAETDTDDLWDGDTLVHEAGYLTDLLGNHAVSFVEANRQGPFFLSLHFSAPHWPWEGPGDEAESKRIRNLRHYDGGSQATYAAMVRQMDLQVGRLMKTLEQSGLARNTMVVFTSDNGGERFADTWPFTGKKTELLEGGIRIPSIIRWPGHVPAGKTSQQVAISMDWMPTLLELAGAPGDPAYPSDGMSLASVLQGSSAPVPRRLFWRYKSQSQRAIRDGDMKFLKIAENTFLFDVVKDPLERANLKDRHPDVFHRLSNVWDDWNKTMLPEDPSASVDVMYGDSVADHYGVKRPR